MAVDLAIDFGTHDLVVSPNRDLDIRSGQATIDQRIRVRLAIVRGEWVLDPTRGKLGSRIRDMLRLLPARAIIETQLVVKEALEDMDDIEVVDVQVTQNPDKAAALDVVILYRMTPVGAGDEEVLSTAITVG